MFCATSVRVGVDSLPEREGGQHALGCEGLPVEPDALYLTLARLIARAQNHVHHPRADLVPVRPKRNVVRRS